MSKAALLAGKHVVVEKPFTNTSQEAKELIEIALSKNLILTIYHNKRLEGDFKTVKKLLSEKRLGEVTKFSNTVHRYKPEIGKKAWKENKLPGAGLLYDFGSHLIDQVLVLFGWPLDIDVNLQIQRKNSKVIDYFHITFKYNNLEATISSDMLTKEEGKPTYEIEGTNASFIKYGLEIQEANLAKKTIDWDSLGIAPIKNYGTLTTTASSEKTKIPTEDGSYMDFHQNIFEAIRFNKLLLIKPEEALNVIKMIEWILKKDKTKT
jgi:predicted dehydrogenase